jgi:hypothetical protein
VSGFLEDLARIDRRRVRGAPVEPLLPVRADPAAPGIRAHIAAMLRDGPRPPRSLVAPTVLRDLAGGIGEIPGASIERVGSEDVFTIRRDVAELLDGDGPSASIVRGLRSLEAREPEAVDRGLRAALGCALSDLLVLDLETTGFWGCPIFLVGMLYVEGDRLTTVQYLARDYSEEAGIVRGAMEMLDRRALLVTFNGKSYDVPCLRERAAHHREGWRARGIAHVDLLHPARRLYRATLPDCRLVTLEREIVGIHRTGDVASADIPAVYHHFTATGFWESLRPVLHHSRIDLVTTACLFGELLAAQERDEFPRPRPRPKKRARAKKATAKTKAKARGALPA